MCLIHQTVANWWIKDKRKDGDRKIKLRKTTLLFNSCITIGVSSRHKQRPHNLVLCMVIRKKTCWNLTSFHTRLSHHDNTWIHAQQQHKKLTGICWHSWNRPPEIFSHIQMHSHQTRRVSSGLYVLPLFLIILTALHGMQMRYSDELSVCLSVCPSVCL